MTIYFFFGKTGSGKTYISNLLEKHGIEHVNGDNYITDEMKECLEKDKQMTPDMIDRYVNHLIKVINKFRQSTSNQSFIVSQALYLNKHRIELLKSINDLQLVHIRTPDVLRGVRIDKRFMLKESKVSLEYAVKMDDFFEEPSVPVMNIENSYQDDTSLLRGLQILLKDLDLEFQNENKENLVRVCA